MTNVHTYKNGRGFVLGNKAQLMEVFAKNGFHVLWSVTWEEQTSEVNADQIYQGKGGPCLHPGTRERAGGFPDPSVADLSQSYTPLMF